MKGFTGGAEGFEEEELLLLLLLLDAQGFGGAVVVGLFVGRLNIPGNMGGGVDAAEALLLLLLVVGVALPHGLGIAPPWLAALLIFVLLLLSEELLVMASYIGCSTS